MQPSQNNLATEIILGIVAGLIAIAAPILLYLGTINFNGALAIWSIAGAIVGVKLALNAPSPSQQAQLNAQNVNLQQLVQYALSVLPGLVQQSQPVATPQSQQTAQPVQVQSPAPTPAVPPVANPVTPTPPVQTQFKQPVQIPDVSMPMAAISASQLQGQ